MRIAVLCSLFLLFVGAPGARPRRYQGRHRSAREGLQRRLRRQRFGAVFRLLRGRRVLWFPEGRTDVPSYRTMWTAYIHGGARLQACTLSDYHLKLSRRATRRRQLSAARQDARGRQEVTNEIFQETDVWFQGRRRLENRPRTLLTCTAGRASIVGERPHARIARCSKFSSTPTLCPGHRSDHAPTAALRCTLARRDGNRAQRAAGGGAGDRRLPERTPHRLGRTRSNRDATDSRASRSASKSIRRWRWSCSCSAQRFSVHASAQPIAFRSGHCGAGECHPPGAHRTRHAGAAIVVIAPPRILIPRGPIAAKFTGAAEKSAGLSQAFSAVAAELAAISSMPAASPAPARSMAFISTRISIDPWVRRSRASLPRCGRVAGCRMRRRCRIGPCRCHRCSMLTRLNRSWPMTWGWWDCAGLGPLWPALQLPAGLAVRWFRLHLRRIRGPRGGVRQDGDSLDGLGALGFSHIATWHGDARSAARQSEAAHVPGCGSAARSSTAWDSTTRRRSSGRARVGSRYRGVRGISIGKTPNTAGAGPRTTI